MVENGEADVKDAAVDGASMTSGTSLRTIDAGSAAGSAIGNSGIGSSGGGGGGESSTLGTAEARTMRNAGGGVKSIKKQREKYIKQRLLEGRQSSRPLTHAVWLAFDSFQVWSEKVAAPFLNFGSYGFSTSNSMVAFLWFWFLVVLDVLMIFFYIIERGYFESFDESTPDLSTVVNVSQVTVDGQWWTTNRPHWLYVSYVVISFIIALATLFRMFVIKIQLYRALAISVIDLITVFLFIASVFDTSQISIIYVPAYLRIWVLTAKVNQIFIMMNHSFALQSEYDVVHEKIFLIAMTVFAFVLTGMMAIQWAENIWGEPLTLFNSLYLMVVTVSTVGYGDITPQSVQGRMIIIAIIIAALYVIPLQISALADAFILRRASGGSYRKSWLAKFFTNYEPHVVLCVPSAHETSVVDALNELISGVYSSSNLKIVVMLHSQTSLFLKNLSNLPYYRDHVSFIQGSFMDGRDLRRAKVRDSKAVFLLSDKYYRNLVEADRHNTIRAWAVREHAPSVPIYVLNNVPDYKAQLQDAHCTISVQTYKQAIMALNCLHCGVSPMLMNLWRQASPIKGSKPWIEQYSDGLNNEMFEAPVSAYYINKTFSFMCLDAYERYSVIVVGIRTYIRAKRVHHTMLNPTAVMYDYIIQEEDIAFFISHSATRLQSGTLYDIFTSVPNGSDNSEGRVHMQTIEMNELQTPEVAALEARQRFMDQSLFTVYARSHENEPLKVLPLDQSDQKIGGFLSVQEFVELVEIGFLDPKFQECFLLKKPVESVDDAEIKDARKFSAHVIVFGSISEIFPIVFVSQERPTQEDWRIFSKFPLIYFLVGDPSKTHVLERSNVVAARRICVVGDVNGRTDIDSSENLEEPMVDVKSIMMTHKIINITSPEKHKDIQTELTYRNNWHFIPPIRKISDEDIPTGLSVDYRYLLSPPYVSGRIISSSMIDGLLFHVFSRENVMGIFDLLCNLKRREQYELDDFLGVHQQRVHCIDIPTRFFTLILTEQSTMDGLAPSEHSEDIEPTFGRLFRYLMINYGVLAIGLYRQGDEELGNTDFNFVYTNPWKSSIVTTTDRVFVIASPHTNPLYHKARNEREL